MLSAECVPANAGPGEDAQHVADRGGRIHATLGHVLLILEVREPFDGPRNQGAGLPS